MNPATLRVKHWDETWPTPRTQTPVVAAPQPRRTASRVVPGQSGMIPARCASNMPVAAIVVHVRVRRRGRREAMTGRAIRTAPAPPTNGRIVQAADSVAGPIHRRSSARRHRVRTYRARSSARCCVSMGGCAGCGSGRTAASPGVEFIRDRLSRHSKYCRCVRGHTTKKNQ